MEQALEGSSRVARTAQLVKARIRLVLLRLWRWPGIQWTMDSAPGLVFLYSRINASLVLRRFVALSATNGLRRASGDSTTLNILDQLFHLGCVALGTQTFSPSIG